MKVLAFVMVALGIGGLLASVSNHYEKQPFDDGVTTIAVVVDRATVEFFDTNGEFRLAEVGIGSKRQPGDQIEISYRPTEPSNVRAPDLVPNNEQFAFIFGFLLVGGITLLSRQEFGGMPRNRHKITGSLLRNPGHLFASLEPLNLSGQLLPDERIVEAFLVKNRRPLWHTLVPFSAICGALAAMAHRSGSDVAQMMAIFGMVIGIAALPVINRRDRDGIVAVTEFELVLVETPDNDLGKAIVKSRLPRGTQLPSVGTNRGSIYGGPLPFPNDQASPKQWYYRGTDLTLSGAGYVHLIRKLQAESRAVPQYTDDYNR